MLLLCRGLIQRNQCLQRLDVVAHCARITINADNGSAAHVLHYAYTVTLWSL